MSDRVVPQILLRGIHGFLEGEHMVLGLGQSVVVGRSRGAELSLKRAKKFTVRADRIQLAKTERFMSVSRRHVRIHFLHPDLVEVEDLSTNGTLVDGRRIDRIGLTDIRTTSHEIRLGSIEKLSVEWHNGKAEAPPEQEE